MEAPSLRSQAHCGEARSGLRGHLSANDGAHQSRCDNLHQHPAIQVGRRIGHQRAAGRAGSGARARIPDLTLSAGMQGQFEQNGRYAFLLGVSVPVPLFDANGDATAPLVTRIDARPRRPGGCGGKIACQSNARRRSGPRGQKRLALLENDGPALLPGRPHEASVPGLCAGKFDLTSTLDARKGPDRKPAWPWIDAARALNTENHCACEA